MNAETATFLVAVTLSTENGELPTDGEVERLVQDQMAGELDPETGLTCLAVTVSGRTAGSPPNFTATFDPDCWEYFHELLAQWTKKNLVVQLNDGPAVQLHRIEGDIYDGPATLVVTDVDDTESEQRIELFDSNGTTITKAHVL